ncbi:MAG TPA: hypothetical protein VGL92_17570 [Acidimicrobiia bacterium]
MNPARKATVAIAVAAAVTLAVAGAVWRFGVVPVPLFPSLAVRPDPSIPGMVAFRGDDDCLRVVPAAGGAVRRVGPCDDDGFGPGSFREPRREPRLADGSKVKIPYDDEQRARIVARAPDGKERTLVSVRAPADYSFETVVVSPDGRFLLAVDGEGRLLIGTADGSSGLRLLATGAEPYGQPVWHQPAWVGQAASPAPASR